jgi:hypothetical protein
LAPPVIRATFPFTELMAETYSTGQRGGSGPAF